MIFYAAYGSNLNKNQMLSRCPKSKPYTGIILNNWQLVFKGVADIEIKKNSFLFLGLYRITRECEKKLDVYEEFPKVYDKLYFNQIVKGKKIRFMIYSMNSKFDYSLPTCKYFKTIEKGFIDWNFNLSKLNDAGLHSFKNNTKKGYKSKNWNDKKKLSLEELNAMEF